MAGFVEGIGLGITRRIQPIDMNIVTAHDLRTARLMADDGHWPQCLIRNSISDRSAQFFPNRPPLLRPATQNLGYPMCGRSLRRKCTLDFSVPLGRERADAASKFALSRISNRTLRSDRKGKCPTNVRADACWGALQAANRKQWSPASTPHCAAWSGSGAALRTAISRSCERRKSGPSHP